MLGFKLLALRALAAAADTGASSSDPCYADGSNTFTVSLDEAAVEAPRVRRHRHAGPRPGEGVTYTFEQRDAPVPRGNFSLGAAREPPRPRSVERRSN